MDGPTSHWGELVYAGHYKVSHNQDERNPPVEECTRPSMGQCTRDASTKLARVLLLCTRWCYASCRTTRFP